jgi:hypothetical protein
MAMVVAATLMVAVVMLTSTPTTLTTASCQFHPTRLTKWTTLTPTDLLVRESEKRLP